VTAAIVHLAIHIALVIVLILAFTGDRSSSRACDRRNMKRSSPMAHMSVCRRTISAANLVTR
jgi:hypothetical protein